MSVRDEEIAACVEAVCGSLLDEACASDEERAIAHGDVSAAFERYGASLEGAVARLESELRASQLDAWFAEWRAQRAEALLDRIERHCGRGASGSWAVGVIRAAREGA